MPSVLQQRSPTVLVSTRRPWTICLRWLRQAMMETEASTVAMVRKSARNPHRQTQPQHPANLDAVHGATQNKVDEAIGTKNLRSQLARMSSHHV